MSTPTKPWEGTNNMNFENLSGPGISKITGVVQNRPLMNGMTILPNTARRYSTNGNLTPPPLPPMSPHRMPNFRDTHHQSYSHMLHQPRWSNYSGYMGGFSPFSSYGGYHRRMMLDDYDSGMMQIAEESCQALFGPLDSVVRSVSSIAMVLDSTLQAMQFSFRTVLSAADSLSRLKSVIFELTSSMTIFKIIRDFFSRIFSMLGLVKGRTGVEKEWAEACAKAADNALPSSPRQSPWPAVVFFSLMMGGPYLMFKMFSQQTPRPSNGNVWTPGVQDSIPVVALFDFEATCSTELSMKKGDQLFMRLSPSKQGWVMVSDGQKSGFVPANRLSKIGKKKSASEVKDIIEPILYSQ